MSQIEALAAGMNEEIIRQNVVLNAYAKRIAELERLLAVRPQDECTERMTLQPDGSLRCHHCGHVVPASTKSTS